MFSVNELMLTHHELASPRFLTSLHELNCNQYAVRHNSYRRQFTKARLSIHASAGLQFIGAVANRKKHLRQPHMGAIYSQFSLNSSSETVSSFNISISPSSYISSSSLPCRRSYPKTESSRSKSVSSR